MKSGIANRRICGIEEKSAVEASGWAVEDIRKAVTTLRAKGVQFETYDGMEHDDLGIWTAPDGAQVTWFKNVDGNVLSISQDTDWDFRPTIAERRYR